MIFLNIKIYLIIFQLLCTIIFSGIVFGWAPFELMMIEEGLYSCNNNNININNEEEECTAQNTNLKMLFTLSTSTFMISSLFVGLFVDYYGPTYTTILVIYHFIYLNFVLFLYILVIIYLIFVYLSYL